MRVFIGYGYNDRDRWIEKYVFPLVTAFGCEVRHGKAVYGGALVDEVLREIRNCDAMFGFTTRRDALATPGQYTTHDWVEQELVTANSQVPRIPWVEVREEGVVPSSGMLQAANPQRIDYREDDRAWCLVQLAEALDRLKQITRVVSVRLGPGSAVEQITPLLDHRSFRCTFQILRGTRALPPEVVPVLPIKGALFVQIVNLMNGDLVRLTIDSAGRTWRSDYDSVDTVDMQVREQ